MRKFTLLSLLIAFAIFASAQKKTTNKGLAFVKQNEKVSYVLHNATGGMKLADTDTLSNIEPTEQLALYTFQAPGSGYLTGHNGYNIAEYAEKFTNPLSGEVNGALVFVGKAVSGSVGNSVTFNVYTGGTLPGAILGSKTVVLTDLTAGGLNDITFDTPIAVPAGDFYIGYQINYVTPADTFALYCAEMRPSGGLNTAYLNAPPALGGVWSSYTALSASAITSYGIFARMYLNTPLSPTLLVTPSSWNAGDIETGTSATSQNFTITNIGQGTLTITSANGVSSPFSSTLVPASVSLAQSQSTTFSFAFNPSVAGTFNQSYVITSNGGIDTIFLTGVAHDPLGDMLGTFENITDFELVFPSWTQIDNDGGATYGFTGITFTNSGYTGSFIAFNPASTTPTLSADVEIQPHGGSKFGACISAVTASAPNDDWLITPLSPVITTGSSFKAWVKTYDNTWGLERYSIWVSTTNTNQASFTKISTGTFQEAPITWTEISYNLDAYAGQQIYVAIQCVSNDAFVFMVDDILFDIFVDVNKVKTSDVSVYPNPSNSIIYVANAENAYVVVVDMLGKVVAEISKASNFNSIDISNMAEGSYFVKIQTKDNVITKRINLVK